MNKHFIFDFETFGQSDKCAVVNCAVAIFDWDRLTSDNPYTFSELLNMIKLFKLDVKDQVKRYDYRIEKSCLDWWSTLPKEVQKQTVPNPNDLNLEEFCDQLLQYLDEGNIKIWWSRGNTFDPIILMRIFKDCDRLKEIENILKFWLVRDTRTYTDALTSFCLKKNAFMPLDEEDQKIFKAHNSIHDVAVDILRLQYLEQEMK